MPAGNARRLRGVPLRRRLLALGLVLGVIGAHAVLGRWVMRDIDDWWLAEAMPERLQAAFTRELQAADPVAMVRAAPRTAPAAMAAPAAEPAASAPQAKVARKPKPTPKPPVPAVPLPAAREADDSSATAVPPASTPDASAVQSAASDAAAPSASQMAQAEPEVPGTPAAAPPAALAEPAARADAASPPTPGSPPASGLPFDWPASTQIRYLLSGWYRGEVQGSAQVEWVRQGTRYQVHLDVIIGPPFAPLMSRRMTSDGVLGEHGLQPLRYDEETRVALGQPRRLSIRFEPDAVVLPNGRRVERTQGVQDAASQFVQLTWMFTLQPELLRQGRTVDVMLALPRHVDRWVFDVMGEETLQVPFGAVDTVHIRPRRVARAGTDRTAEVWVAPRLQYLPVRIRIRQDEETYVDLMIDRPPLQATK